MAEYIGWLVYDKVKIVKKFNSLNKYGGIPQAYIVNVSDKKQLSSALRWANGCGKTADPEVIETDNKDFKISLLDSAGSSYQGGRLSFWNCLIEKKSENIKVVVGISADILLTLLLQNQFNNGVCKKSVMFARKQGKLGVITKDMNEFKEAQSDIQIKKTLSTNKTTKWQVGYNYITPTIDETYLGCLYVPLELHSPTYEGYSYNSCDWILKQTKQQKKHIIIQTKTLTNSDIKSLSDLYRQAISTIDKNFNTIINETNTRATKRLDKLYNGIIILNVVYKSTSKDTLPSRKHGTIELEKDMDINELYTKIINYLQNKAVELIKLYPNIRIWDIEKFIVRLESIDINSLDTDLTNKEKIILNQLFKTNRIIDKTNNE